ncbi:MAG: NAD(P)H-hydrate dehydratase [Deltaproteobacteria bacterium]|nr:NAD(P)H-hydrate dehydratase [Deltaproteobacteria bacterium]
MIVTTAAEMRRIDAFTIEHCGVPAAVLMERAGNGAVAALLARFPHVRKAGVVVLAGKGNNGGDGFVVARGLKRRKIRCEVILAAGRADVREPARGKLRAWARAGGKTTTITARDLGPLQRALARSGCVVDALFGTGLTGELTGLAAEAIMLVNASGLPTVALDIPSGLDADRGVPLGVAIEAELTVAFAAPKIGTVIYPGARNAGELAVVDIGIPDAALQAVAPTTEAVLAADAAALLRGRDPESHKGSNGHVLLVAGGRGKTGAVVLASRAAARAGAGLVTAGIPAGEQQAVAARLLEEMTAPLPDDGEGGFAFPSSAAYTALLDGKSALVTGPGIGVSEARRALVAWLVTHAPLPMVVDADALNCLATAPPDGAWGAPGRPRIVTPHPGEMARLSGLTTGEVQADRIAAARRLAAARGVIVVLKGARTVVAEPDGRVAINCSGNAGLGSGGTGDVLAGVIGGLLAQGYPAADAARLGVFLHGYAADRVAARRGMIGLLASDVIEELPAATAALADVPTSA